MPDYRIPDFSFLQRIIRGIAGFVIGGILMYVLLHVGWIAMIGGGICAAAYPYFAGKHRTELVRRKLMSEFRECLGQMLTIIRSGRSAERMIYALTEDMDSESFPLMYPEILHMGRELHNQRTIEELWMDLGKRSGSEDILDFAEIIRIGKRSRGNLSEIMEHSVQILEDKIEAQEELKVMLANRKLEQRLMSAAPFLVLLILQAMSPDYLRTLFSTGIGRIVLTASMLVLVLSMVWAWRIGSIQL